MRIWDSFLTDRDKKHLATVKNPPRIGFGKVPALLLIDNFKAVLGEERLPLEESIQRYPLSMGLEAWTAVEHQESLLRLARQLGILVIHTTQNGQANAPLEFYSALRLSPKHRAQTSVKSRINPTGQPDIFDFVPQLKPIADEVVLLKTGPSAFYGTPLLSVLQQFHVDTLLVCGESTSGCVRASVVDAGTGCFRTIVVEEGVYDRHQSSHAMALFDMDQKYADVCSLNEVRTWLESMSKDAATTRGDAKLRQG